jgi:chemotaxis protein MotB
MSAHHGRGRKRGGHEEEHENHERWAVSYADMMTVLMALFLVLYAMSSVDSVKYEALRTSLAAGFGNEALPTVGGTGILDGATGDPVPVGEEPPAAVAPAADTAAAAQAEADRLAEVRDRIQAALDAAGRGDAAQMRITERGLEVVIVSDDVFFANASADLQPGGAEVLGAIAPVLATLTEDLAIEGHTNHLRLTGGPFTSNWALSAMRATAVLTQLTDVHGLDPARLMAVGYADTQPLVPVGDPAAIATNRRVDVVVLSPAPSAVKAQLPDLAGAQPGAQPGVQPDAGGAAPEGVVPAPVDLAAEQVARTTGTEVAAPAAATEHAADHAAAQDGAH